MQIKTAIFVKSKGNGKNAQNQNFLNMPLLGEVTGKSLLINAMMNHKDLPKTLTNSW